MSGGMKTCRRCLIDEMMKNSKAELAEYIGSLSDEIKVGEEEYQRRLAICEECEHLLNGVCRLCGCFVRARAAKKALGCPAIRPKWLKAE